jgi:cytochrome c553
VTKFITALVAVFLATAAVAAVPETVKLNAKQGTVTFNHKAHSAKPKDGCKACHGNDKGGKIAGLDKEKGHAMCHECHKKEGKGPQKCAECHKK